MTTPATEAVEQQQKPKQKWRHKLCAEEIARANAGKVREALCGKVISGPRKPGRRRRSPLCPMCADLVRPHVAACPLCRAAVDPAKEAWWAT